MKKNPFTKDRDGMWKAMRQLRTFTRVDIARLTGHQKTSVSTYVGLLHKAGFLSMKERALSSFHNERVYTLIKDVGHRRPELDGEGRKAAPSARQKMWSALKVVGKSPFDFRDLSLVADVPPSLAKEYCTYLKRGGYLREVRESVPGTTARYVFIASVDTGPMAPEIRKKKTEVWDANTRKVVWQRGGGDVQS